MLPSQPKTFLRVENLWVRKGGLRGYKWILKDVSFDVKQGEFVAIIGPNGAGKTKLLEAILGDRPYSGKVTLYNQDLYANPEHWLQYVGWVPSYNVLHDSLRVEQALLQIGKLRLPGRADTVIRKRVDTLLNELEFPRSRRHALIRELSSGERKRLDLCAELLTNPPLLILDEPTTNLDPDAERSLMELLRKRSLAKRQSVIVVTHTLQSLYYCDRVIFMARGRARAQGDYRQVLDQLEQELGNGQESQEEILPGILPVEVLDRSAEVLGNDVLSGESLVPDKQQDDASRWADIYRLARKFDNEPVGNPPLEQAFSSPEDKAAARHIRPRPKNLIHETGVLLQRNWLLFVNNLPALGLYLLLGPFSGLLSRLVLRDNAFIQDQDVAGYSSVFDTTDARQAIFIIALVVTLLGMIGSFLDVIKERLIYRYERVKGLSPWAYLISKWIVLAGLVGLLSPSFLMAVLTFQGQEMLSVPYVLITLYLACIASVTLGLAISAAASSERAATGLLGIVVVFHLFFSGGVDFNERFRGLLEQISVFSASHWAAEGISTSIQLYCWSSTPRFQDFASLGHLWSVWLFLVIYIFIALILAFVALRLQDGWFPFRVRLAKAVFNEHVWIILPVLWIVASWAFFFQTRSQEYYYLRDDQDDVRITQAENWDQFQYLSGYVSQSLCPLPTPLPPIATPMVALLPTSQPAPTQAVAVTGLASYTATPVLVVDSTKEPTPGDVSPEEDVAPLPAGTLLQSTAILFGPEHADWPLEMLPAQSNIILLGKDASQSWFRIKELSTGRDLVGWVPASSTDLAPSETGLIAHPPRCAAPRAYLEANDPAPMVEWNSDVTGHVVAVVDLFRDEAGIEFPASQFFVALVGQTTESYPINLTRQSFIFRGLAVDMRVKQGDLVRFLLSEARLPGVALRLRVSVFFVPAGCSF